MPLLADAFSTRAIVVQLGFASFILAIAATLAISNRRARNRSRGEALGDEEQSFFDTQFRRRQSVNLLMAVVAVALGAGVLVRQPIAMTLYWIGVILIVLWIGVLAMWDWFNTHLYYQKIRADQLVKKAALEAEIRRLKETKGNGKPRPS